MQSPGFGQAIELVVAPWPKLITGGSTTVRAVPHGPAASGAARASGTPTTVVLAAASMQASTDMPASRPLIDLIQAPLETMVSVSQHPVVVARLTSDSVKGSLDQACDLR